MSRSPQQRASQAQKRVWGRLYHWGAIKSRYRRKRRRPAVYSRRSL